MNEVNRLLEFPTYLCVKISADLPYVSNFFYLV